MQATQEPNKQASFYTLLLLSLGYFIDFYDLSIMGVSYNEMIPQLFHITENIKIQQTYLLISNFQTVGIFIGAITFGILGDKIGRITTIKYSILLYSLSTIAAIFTHSLPVFLALRLLAYVGLSCEFSTSTVVILESMPNKLASWGSSMLYICGVLGGILATGISFVSWKWMFIFGGVAGLVLLVFRIRMQESLAFLYLQQQTTSAKRGNIQQLFNSPQNIWKIIKYLFLILPFYVVITAMFIFPSYIVAPDKIAYATKLLLMGFFIGNIISSILSAIINNWLKSYLPLLWISIVLFVTSMLLFDKIPSNYLFIYSLLLGIICGGYPISWAQQVSLDYPIENRSTASNLLFALGRGSGIVFNILMSIALGVTHGFNQYIWWVTIITTLLAIVAICYVKNTYTVDIVKE